jgi:hypothetical protein
MHFLERTKIMKKILGIRTLVSVGLFTSVIAGGDLQAMKSSREVMRSVSSAQVSRCADALIASLKKANGAEFVKTMEDTWGSHWLNRFPMITAEEVDTMYSHYRPSIGGYIDFISSGDLAEIGITSPVVWGCDSVGRLFISVTYKYTPCKDDFCKITQTFFKRYQEERENKWVWGSTTGRGLIAPQPDITMQEEDFKNLAQLIIDGSVEVIHRGEPTTLTLATAR